MLVAPRTRERSDSEMVIHGLCEITSRYDFGFERQVREFLELGRDRFDLDVGILARVQGSRFELVEVSVPAGIPLEKGDRFDLPDTYCSTTVRSNVPVCVRGLGDSDRVRPPSFGMYQPESYIGIPIQVKGRFFGTLSFSSAEPRLRPFERADVECLRLMQSWLVTELQRRGMESELLETRRHLEHLVRTDPLTELANRRGVVETLRSYSRRSSFGEAALSCALVDIDDFKSVNDLFGHSTGDRVIRAVADSVRDSIRPSDVAGRIGGDEFLAILPGASVYEAQGVAERIGESIRRLDLRTSCGRLPVTVSIGVAEVPTGISSVTDVLAATEALLRRSKLGGKNMVSA